MALLHYTHADGVPQYIIMLKDAQKKATRAGMPIADIELVMIVNTPILGLSQGYPSTPLPLTSYLLPITHNDLSPAQ
jgi:hypothetical protein